MKKMIQKFKNWFNEHTIYLAGVDGMAHILVNVLLIAYLYKPFGWWAIPISICIDILKEVIDMEEGDTKKNSKHDIICDVIGIVLGILIII